MSLFHRNKTDTAAIPEDLQPYYSSQGTGLRRWVGPILRALVLLIVLALLVWGGIVLVHKLTKSSGKKSTAQTTSQTSGKSTAKAASKSTTTKQTASSSAVKTTPAATPTPTPTPAATPTPTPAPAAATPSPDVMPSPRAASATPATTPSATANQDLTNTGPGNIFALFAVVVVSATLFHRFFFGRRAQS
jgi:cytoskeletal protein RodZ